MPLASPEDSIMFEALLQALISGLSVGGAYALVALGFSITFTTTKTPPGDGKQQNSKQAPQYGGAGVTTNY